ncbi:putative tetratricopeptide-like helical domain superfamily [Dioscorea sansibarensis]
MRTHCRLIKSGIATDTYTWNNVLTAYSRRSGPLDAHKLFEEIPQRDSISWNSLIASYVAHGWHFSAWCLLKTMMRCGLLVDRYTLGSVLKSVANAVEVGFGRQLHALMVKAGLDKNVFSGSALLDVYAKCRVVEDAYLVFVLMPERNLVTWNSVISACAQVGQLEMALQLFDELEREELAPDEATFATILTLVDKPAYYSLMLQLHTKIIKHCRVVDIVVYNATITAYSQCGSIIDAVKVFEGMGDVKDLVSWNSMLAAYAFHGTAGAAIKLFARMQQLNIDQDMYTYTSMLSACFEHGKFCQGRALHGLVIKKGLDREVPVSNALIAMYIRYNDNCMIEDAVKCFHHMEVRDTISWNSILTGLSQNGLSEEALKFYCHMQSFDISIDHYAFSTVIRSCSDLAVLQLGQLVHGSILKSGFDSSEFVASSLIYMYSKCGFIEDAQRIFDYSNKESSVLWNSIIFAYAQHGQGQIAVSLFSDMQKFEVKPDHITFVGILSACSHSGLVEEGFAFLKSMEASYGIPLRMEHYACAVDLYGRAGRLDEAKELIESMPFEPDAMVWMTLLGACRVHGNIEMAIHVARHLLLMEPREHSTYVLLSNMYARFGMWDGRAMIQKAMRNGGVSKVPGWSWIEVNKKVHSFNAEDTFHPQTLEIYATLGILMDEMQIIGHFPLTEAELYLLYLD